MSEQLYDKFRRLSPKVTGGLIRMRSDTFRDSTVPAKYKMLCALAIVVATKCEPCIIGYTKMAYEAGTTESELVEFLNVAIIESGCPGEQWAMIALKTYSELEAGKKFEEADICCHDKNTNGREIIVKDLICYCFEYSADDIEQDYLEHGKSTIMEKIQKEKKFGNCKCATKNPKGKGCLGDVRQVVNKLSGKSALSVITGNVFGRKVFAMINDNQSTNIVTLDSSLESLKERFNSDHEKIRFLTLLSPTCPMGRDKGARAVHENVFQKFADADVSASIVWIPILKEDTFDEVLPSVRFLSDSRIQHFYDSKKMAGKAIADSVGWVGNVAWDIYLFYRPFVEWTETPPKPLYWMHQLPDWWATKYKYRTGEDLKNELSTSVEKMLTN